MRRAGIRDIEIEQKFKRTGQSGKEEMTSRRAKGKYEGIRVGATEDSSSQRKSRN